MSHGQGKPQYGQGNVREKSGNFVRAHGWTPCKIYNWFCCALFFCGYVIRSCHVIYLPLSIKVESYDCTSVSDVTFKDMGKTDRYITTTKYTKALRQGSFCLCTQPMRDDITMWHRLLLAGCIHKMIATHSMQNLKLLRNSTAWFCCWNKNMLEQNRCRCFSTYSAIIWEICIIFMVKCSWNRYYWFI